VIAPISFSAAGQCDPTGLGIAVARVNIFNYVGFVLGAVIVTIVQPLASLRVSFMVPAALTVVILILAKGFEPAQRAVVEGEPYALAQRPVV
jgi:MFS family permease